MARKKPHNIKASGIPERIARTDAKGKQTQLETRLGRLLVKLPVGWSLHNYSGNTWSVIDNTGKANVGATPIDALLAAGITDD